MNYVTIRWQETWGDRLQGDIPGHFATEEAAEVLADLAGDWFPGGFDLNSDPDSTGVWRAHAISDLDRVVWFFLEPAR